MKSGVLVIIWWDSLCHEEEGDKEKRSSVPHFLLLLGEVLTPPLLRAIFSVAAGSSAEWLMLGLCESEHLF